MIRYTTLLTLAALMMAAPDAVALQAGQDVRVERQPTGHRNGSGGPFAQPKPTTAPSAQPRVVSPPQDPYSGRAAAGNPTDSEKHAGNVNGGSGGVDAYGALRNTSTENSGGAAPPAGAGVARAYDLILKASEVPTQNGQIAWPSVFRLVGADSKMQQFEAQLQLGAEQLIAGGSNPRLSDEIRLTVDDLDRSLKADRKKRWPCLPSSVYDDGEQFLKKLKQTPRFLAAAAPSGR